MYEIKVQSSFSAAHNLRNYRGKCENLHGHNWKVDASFFYKTLDKDGMAVDFKEAKGLLKKELKEDFIKNVKLSTGCGRNNK